MGKQLIAHVVIASHFQREGRREEGKKEEKERKEFKKKTGNRQNEIDLVSKRARR